MIGNSGAASAEVERSRGQRRPREISVETYPSRLESDREDWGLLPAHKSERSPPSPKETEDEKNEIGFFSGNPFVELTKGILHLYKEDALSSRQDAVTLCLLAVPATMTCHDLLSFTAPCHAEISHIRVYSMLFCPKIYLFFSFCTRKTYFWHLKNIFLAPKIFFDS